MNTGLVLEGGGVRGIYTAGVLDVFLENDISFDGVIGVSAGAIHGCSYLSKQKGRSLRYYMKYSRDPRFMGFRTWLRTGDIVGADFCYHELPDKLDIYDHEAFLKNPAPFYAVCSDVDAGRAEYMRITDMRAQIDILRASASLPYFSHIVHINGKSYLDGGCTDSIPVEAFMDMGYRRNVVVLTREAGYMKKPELKLLPGIAYRRYPAFAEALRTRHSRYNAQLRRIDELEKEGSIFVIRPSVPLDIGRLDSDPASIKRVYDTGYADAMRLLAKLTAWMNRE